MAALKPEDCDLMLFEAIRNNDLEAAVAVYEPNAVFIVGPGEMAVGRDAIREVLKGWIQVEEPEFTTELEAFINEEESLAMLRGTWSAIARDADGNPTKISGKNVEVVRRQPDGTWRFVIDHPNGAEVGV